MRHPTGTLGYMTKLLMLLSKRGHQGAYGAVTSEKVRFSTASILALAEMTCRTVLCMIISGMDQCDLTYSPGVAYVPCATKKQSLRRCPSDVHGQPSGTGRITQLLGHPWTPSHSHSQIAPRHLP
ncbi:hypothetical protein VNO77_15390 [Canavalia gladiata]|uniref:Uncharacterized protein n=1 Tax=Canavalia gladiata TaxID=3824 RepID=A0AAN9LYY3_CANGL